MCTIRFISYMDKESNFPIKLTSFHCQDLRLNLCYALIKSTHQRSDRVHFTVKKKKKK